MPRTSNTRCWHLLALTVMLAACQLAFTKESPGVKAVVGLVLPTNSQGKVLNMGQQTLAGVKFAISQLNGPEVQMVVLTYDSGCDSKGGKSKLNQTFSSWVQQNNVSYVVEDLCLKLSDDLVKFASEEEVMLASATAAQSAKVGVPLPPYTYAFATTTNIQGAVMSAGILNAGYKKVAIIATSEAYGADVATAVGQGLQAKKGKVVYNTTVDAKEINEGYSLPLQKIQNSGAQAIVVSTNDIKTAIWVMQQVQQMKQPLPAYGPAPLYNNYFAKKGQPAVNGMFIVAPQLGTQTFQQDYSKFKSGQPLSPNTVIAYNAIQAVYTSLRSVSWPPDYKAVAQKMYNLTFPSASGNSKIDVKGMDIGPDLFDIYQISGSNFEIVEKNILSKKQMKELEAQSEASENNGSASNSSSVGSTGVNTTSSGRKI